MNMRSLIAVATICGSGALAHGETLSIPLWDGGGIYVWQSSPSDPTVVHSHSAGGAHPTVWQAGPLAIRRTWLEFDLSDLPVGACLESATFSFYQSKGINATVAIRGGFEAGEAAYDEAFGFMGEKSIPGNGVFNSVTADGDIFGTAALDQQNNNTWREVDLSVGLGFIASQAGLGKIMLTGALVGDASAPPSFDGHICLGSCPPPTLTIVWTPAAAPDIDGNSQVNGGDLGILLASWGTDAAQADLDCSGIVDGGDLGILLAAWSG